uniref:Uncharacterized protein n=1 Tax=Chrysemys picta bellii TaxID=8478 RepID=A0A8C3F6X4_CHRPI
AIDSAPGSSRELDSAQPGHRPGVAALSIIIDFIVFQQLKNLVSRHPNVVIIALEATDPASIRAAAARVEEHLKGSGLNLLINNAGVIKLSTLESETPEDMSLVYATNVTGPLLVSQVRAPTEGRSLAALGFETIPFPLALVT